MKKQVYEVFSVYVEGRLVGKIDAITGDEAEDNARSKFKVHPSSRVCCVLPEVDPVGGLHMVQNPPEPISDDEQAFLTTVAQWAKKWSEGGECKARYTAVKMLLASVDISIHHMSVFAGTDTVIQYRELVDDEFGWRNTGEE